MSDNIPEVNAQRRRKGSRPTKQTTRPTRRETPPTPPPSTPSSNSGYSGGYSSGGFPPTGSSSSSGGFTPSSSGIGGLGSLGSLLSGLSGGSKSTSSKKGCGSIIFIIILLIVGYFILKSCMGGADLSGLFPQEIEEPQYFATEPQGLVSQPTQISPTRTPWPTAVASGDNSGQKWLVMMYQDADDQALEQDIMIDLNEMEMIGSTDQVMIVSQIDRYRGGYSGDGNWSSTRRYLVTYDDDLNNLGSEMLMDLGEVNMGDSDTLVDFVTWAAESFPADKHVLIMSDHGMGWPGGWSDPSPASRDNSSNAPLTGALKDDIIYLNEMEDALARIQANTGIDKFELIGLDACLMSQMEVYSALQPYTRYAVASEETEPGLGWAYSAFLSLMVYNPDLDTAELATNIVDSYISQDQRVVDDRARADFLAQNSSGGGFYITRMTAEQLADQLERNITLTAVNLENFPALVQAFNDFSYRMQGINQQAVASARSYAQSYTSIFGTNVPASYIDMGHFVQLVAKNSGDNTIRQAANNVFAALNEVVVAEKHGPSKPGSTGIAIYFPNSQLYRTATTGLQSYSVIANNFSRASLWDDFLGFHYSGKQFQPQATEAVQLNTVSRVPGGGSVSVSEISKSANSVTAGQAVDLSATITGTNIGYIYLFTGIFDEASNSIYVADTDYLESPQTDSESGVYYPVWPNSQSFKLNFEFEPLLFTITDGVQSVNALFNPVSYGASAEDAVYAVNGTYIFAETGETRTAQLLFKDGYLFQIIGYVGSSTTGAASEITPNIGDAFTVANKWLDLDATGKISGVSNTDGETISFTGRALSWELVYAPEGNFLIGFLVSDLDGNLTPVYTQITVN